MTAVFNRINFKNKTVDDAKVVLAVQDDIIPDSWTIQVNSTEFYYAFFSTTNTGNHPYLTGNNGNYSNAFWTEVNVKDLDGFDNVVGGADTATLNVLINNRPAGFLLHFDGYGAVENGRAFVPFS